MNNKEFFRFCASIENKKNVSLKIFNSSIPSSAILVEEIPMQLEMTMKTIINICNGTSALTSIGKNLRDTNGLNKEKIQQLFDYVFKDCTLFKSVFSLFPFEVTSIKELIYFFAYFDIKVMNSCYKFLGRLKEDNNLTIDKFSKIIADDLEEDFVVKDSNNSKKTSLSRIITNYLNNIHNGKKGILIEISKKKFIGYVVENKCNIIEESNDIICNYLKKNDGSEVSELKALDDNLNRQLKNIYNKELNDKVLSKINQIYSKSKNYGKSSKKGCYVFYKDDSVENYSEFGIYKYFKNFDSKVIKSFLKVKCPYINTLNLYELDYLILLDLHKYHFSKKKGEFSWLERVNNFISTFGLNKISEIVLLRYNMFLQVFELEYIDFTYLEYLVYKENCEEFNTAVCLYTNQYLPTKYQKSRFFFNALRIKENIKINKKKRFLPIYYSPFTTLEQFIVKMIASVDAVVSFNDICEFFPYQSAFVISDYLGNPSKNYVIYDESEKIKNICKEAGIVFDSELESATKNTPFSFKISENDFIKRIRDNDKNIRYIISNIKEKSSKKVEELVKDLTKNNIFFSFEEDMCIIEHFSKDDYTISRTSKLFSDIGSNKSKQEIVDRAGILDCKRDISEEEQEIWLSIIVDSENLNEGIKEAAEKTYRTEKAGWMKLKEEDFSSKLFERFSSIKKENDRLKKMLRQLSEAKGIDLENLTPTLFYYLNKRVISELREELSSSINSFSNEYNNSNEELLSENCYLKEELERYMKENSKLENQLNGLQKVNITKKNEDILKKISMEEEIEKSFEEYRINTVNKFVSSIKELGLEKSIEDKIIISMLS